MEFSVYENKNFGFKIKYPESWELLDEHPLYAAAFLSPYEKNTKYRAEIIINVIDLSENKKTFDELKQMAPSQLKAFLNDFEIHGQIDTILGGKKAFQIIYSGKMKFGRQKDLDLKYFQVSTLLDNVFYQIAYSHGPKFYLESFPFVKKMIESFEFT